MERQHAKADAVAVTGAATYREGWTMKKRRAIQQSSIMSGINASAAITAALLPATALAGPGDLDPAFGTVGRLGAVLNGPAWSLQPQDDGTMILGGGRPGYSYYYWGGPYYSPPTGFIAHISEVGTIDEGYVTPVVANVQVREIARQPDGQVVAVGRRYLDSNFETWQVAAYRVQSDGSLDTTFADEGLFTLSAEEHGNKQLATSVVLDPDGRIAIAGTRGDKVIVLRLLPDGSIDDSFGTNGLVVGPDNFDFSSDGSGAHTSIIRTADGSYRLTASNVAGCQLLALTAAGAVQAGFGNAGLATAKPPLGASTNCNGLARQADERLLVAGATAGHGFMSRLLPDGEPDGGWSPNAVANGLANATAVAVGGDGSIVVGGPNGTGGGSILRLGSSGVLDPSFGNAGRTVIDLERYYASETIVHDLHVAADGSVLAAGGVDSNWNAFAVRLLGNAGGNAPGVVGFAAPVYEADGEGGEIVLTLRRSGGSSGLVSVSYDRNDDVGESALNGVDYELAAGTLSWADGDTSEREIRIPILVDEAVEGQESFDLALSNVQGGAGLGAYAATAIIPADGKPFGQLSLGGGTYFGTEGAAVLIDVWRNYYSSGPVSITVTPRPGTAEAGLDFDASPVTLSWADGEMGTKSATIPIINDTAEESTESFTVELTNATGGAITAWPELASVHIGASDLTPAAQDSGGGSMGFVSMLLLGLASLLRRVSCLLRQRRARE
jgi:uncharacterized delta-60 repeat protein